MAQTHETVADVRSESFPDYQQQIEDAYSEGYDPVSLGAPHSSLNTRSMWIAMALILAAMFGVGLSVWGLAVNLFGMGSEVNIGNRLLILGLAEFVIASLAAFLLIRFARRGYNEYRERTGRRH